MFYTYYLMALSFHYLYLIVMCLFLVFHLISYRRLGLAHLFDKQWPLAVKALPVYTLRIGLTPRSLRRNVRHSNSAKYRSEKYLAFY